MKQLSASRCLVAFGLVASLLTVSWEEAVAQTRLRLVAANLTSGGKASYEPAGSQILAALKPDVVMIQEFNVGDRSPSAISSWVTATFGAGYFHYREPGNQNIPNGIISRYPFLATGEIDDPYLNDRDHAWARIDIPGTVDLYAVSVHLKASSGGANSTMREQQAATIREWVQGNVPKNAYLAIGGDFNTQHHNEACLSTLSSLVVASHPYPADQAGNTNTNAGRSRPYDRILVNSALHALQTPVTIGPNSHAHGLVFDSRTYSPLTLLGGVASDCSAATGMQHMAVIRDFRLDKGTPAPVGTNLIISEYVEGSSNNKALEIYNPTSQAINLTGYQVKIHFNGSATAKATHNLTGNLAAGGTHVLVFQRSAPALLARANATFGGQAWNGDDAITLSQGNQIVDSIGRIGEDPGTCWGSKVKTAAQTLRRKPGIITGDTNPTDAFDPSLEYTSAGLDAFDGIGVR
jgi:endonuclease/exonuclease/phosphatase family metal-dependent hydrolase